MKHSNKLKLLLYRKDHVLDLVLDSLRWWSCILHIFDMFYASKWINANPSTFPYARRSPISTVVPNRWRHVILDRVTLVSPTYAFVHKQRIVTRPSSWTNFWHWLSQLEKYINIIFCKSSDKHRTCLIGINSPLFKLIIFQIDLTVIRVSGERFRKASGSRPNFVFFLDLQNLEDTSLSSSSMRSEEDQMVNRESPVLHTGRPNKSNRSCNRGFFTSESTSQSLLKAGLKFTYNIKNYISLRLSI